MLKQSLVRFTSLFLVIPFYAAAQVSDESPRLKNEIGISLLSIQSKYRADYQSDFFVSVLNGIRYKRHLGLHAFRLGGEYRYSWSAVHGDVTGESRLLEGKFNMGYQFSFSAKAIRPYIAIDLFYLVSKLQSEFTGGYLGVYSEDDLLIHGIGYAPAAGLYFKVSQSLSISWEANVEFLWYTEKGTNIRSDPNDFHSRTTYPVNRREHAWMINPIKSISINYEF